MPKKPPRNAFYFFMVDFKEEQRKNGIVYQNMAEVSEASGPLWKDAPSAVRQKYQDMANKEKATPNEPRERYTCIGIRVSELERRERELKEAEERERREILQLIKSKILNESIYSENFFVMDVNYYCHTGNEYVIAEFSVVCFNMMDGIIAEYHQIVSPGDIPMGYGSDAKLQCKELGFDMPNETTKRSNYRRLLANLIEFINPKACLASGRRDLPSLYTMPDKLAPVQSFIQQMCRRAGQDDSEFRIYKIDSLFYELVNGIKRTHTEGFPKESIARIQLVKDMFQFSPGIACEFHDEIDKASVCCLSRAKRWIFTILDHCCPLAEIKMCAGKHVPPGFNLQEVQIYNDKRRKASSSEKNDPEGPKSSVSLDGSSLADSFAASTTLNSSAGHSAGGASGKRVHQPLRMPKTDYSRQLRPAPELKDSDTMLKVGLGRDSRQLRPAPELKESDPMLKVGVGRDSRQLRPAPELKDSDPMLKVGLGRARGLTLFFNPKVSLRLVTAATRRASIRPRMKRAHPMLYLFSLNGI